MSSMCSWVYGLSLHIENWCWELFKTARMVAEWVVHANHEMKRQCRVEIWHSL